MIDKSHGKYRAVCDNCEKELGPADTFWDAKYLADEAGWETKKKDNEWINLCPECAKEV